MPDLAESLKISSARHSHLCPRQVLGARMGLAACELLDIPNGNYNGKLMFVIVESDGCFVDGIIASTGVEIGHRSLRIEDYGKIAATFVSIQSGRALRLSPGPQARAAAWDYAPQAPDHYQAMLMGYQTMPVGHLITCKQVELVTPLSALISRAEARARCDRCGEEIINQREVVRLGQTLCHACASDAYYRVALTCQP
jgi:formylmethanofuran dehydrogenase subunit E